MAVVHPNWKKKLKNNNLLNSNELTLLLVVAVELFFHSIRLFYETNHWTFYNQNDDAFELNRIVYSTHLHAIDGLQLPYILYL